ncbi:hypothetical protein AAEO50_18630 [Rossellomorea oryzaecorticis]|uniref:Uncharacterized protein n=1 Tax=Rossellomorea oryzaecorticis TaxID=1396505 RepID=A0ABU9KE38_9BACI
MKELLKILIDNKDWLFSGVGISVVVLFYTIIKETRQSKNKNEISVDNKPTEVDYEKMTQKEEENSPIRNVVRRFVMVYEVHGIAQTQIPFFIDKEFGLQLKDFKDEGSILHILNDDLIVWTCDKFGIQREWIEGTTNSIYPHVDYYKKVHAFIKDICTLDKSAIDVIAFKSEKLKLKENHRHCIVLLIRIPIDTLNSKIIYKYVPISTLWDWGYWRSRYQVKSIFYICEKLRINICGYDLRDKELLASGSCFPQKLMSKIPITVTWYPEDYIDLPSQSCQAKETEETPKIREYIKEQGYMDLLKDCEKKQKISSW